MADIIVCGWYTPDYAHWAQRLRADLVHFGHAHDLVAVAKAGGGWEVNTLRKAGQALAALHRHPGRVVVFLDVDCQVLAPLDALAGVRGDIAVHLRRRRTLKCRSGTLVLAPTERTHALLARWQDLSAAAVRGTVDQQTLLGALFQMPGLVVEMLDGRYCAVRADGLADAVILHDNAAATARKVPRLMRAAHALGARLSCMTMLKNNKLYRDRFTPRV